nr:AAA family ATPase [Kibdelosporangium sp. MJ126-NF4]CEL13246.1 High-affnity carbon uptake protein Hat/HatR [Kibdelosporangium sp. MJ126-NF4]CTQ98938.1 High-affnity carbon uptake protein Hat/HatR [Kibdelosporangium sp. MJ126-NF4]
MPRPERELDPDTGAVPMFAAELRKLRQQAGNPTYRDLAVDAHYSPATLAAAASGRKLPTLAVTLAYARACGGDEREWEARWREVAAPSALTNGSATLPSPYVGLAAFEPADADRFFGREHLVAELVTLLEEHRLVAVVGPSGAGKSSLLRAGLLPALDTRPVVVLTPAADPFRECAVALGPLLRIPAGALRADLAGDPDSLGMAIRQATADQRPDCAFVLVIDQFEEIFTLCHDAEIRSRFIASLLAATREPGGIRVVFAVRADFYGHCARNPDLVTALREAQILVGPMTTDELRAAIIQPAISAGCSVEGALVSRLIGDATGQAGVLPLVSHALRETWFRRRGNALTLAGYEASGGIDSSVANTAEHVFGAFDPTQQRRARNILLRLTALGEATEDTKRRITRDELDTDPDTTIVLYAMAKARLLTLDKTSVEISHEALIRCWPRLREWLAEDREILRIRRQLTDSTRVWESLDRDREALYRGARLAMVPEDITDDLTMSEQAFVAASRAEQNEGEARTRRRARQLRWLIAALATLLVIVTAAGSVVAVQRRDAMHHEQIALSRQLAAEARTLAIKDVAAAIRLSLDAYQAHPTPEARSALLSLASRRSYQAQLPMHHGMLTGVPVSPDGQMLAVVGEPGRITLWDLPSRRSIGDIRGQFGLVTSATFSQDGRRLATATATGELLLWDVHGRSLLWEDADPDGYFFTGLAFSPDGRWLVASTATRARASALRVWDTTRATPVTTLTAGDGHIASVAVSPDGRLIASTGSDGAVTLWDLPTRQRQAVLPGPGDWLNTVAFSPDGQLIATGGRDKVLRLWDVRARRVEAELHAHQAEIGNLRFTEHGARLYSFDTNGVVLGWDVPRRAVVAQFEGGKPEWLSPFAVSPDGRLVVAADSGAGVLLWDRGALPFLGHTAEINGIVFAADGRTLLSAGTDRSLVAWDLESRTPRHVVPDAQTDTPWAAGPALSRDGSLVATVSDRTEVTIWQTTTLQRVATLSGLSSSAGEAVFSPDGYTLAVIDNSTTLVLWDWARQQRRTVPLGDVTPTDIDYSPDGRMLAIGSHRGQVLVLDATTHATTSTLDFRNSPVSTLTFSPDSRSLVTAAHDGAITVWDTGTWSRKTELAGHNGRVRTAAFSPDQRLLAIAGDDETVTLWDTATNTRWATLSGHIRHITSVAWNPKSSTLASGSLDHSITSWTTDTEAATRGLCDTLVHDFVSDHPLPKACR